MSFSYPAPFEFENGKKKAPASVSVAASAASATSASSTSGKPATARNSTPMKGPTKTSIESHTTLTPVIRATPSRSKSNDESLFSSGAVAMKPRGGLGPKTKSGRHLPKPAPSLPIRTANQSNVRGRAAPKSRGVNQTQSSNLEEIQAARSRSSSLQKTPQRRRTSDEEILREPQSPPQAHVRKSSLTAFLTSPMRKGKKADENMSVQSEQPKHSSLKQFLTSPMRRPSNTRTFDTNSSIGMLDLDADSHAENEPSNDKLKSSSRRARRHAPKEEDAKSSRKNKGKPKTFQQLLGKNQSTGKGGEDDFLDGKEMKVRDVRTSVARRNPAPIERESSLSPEQQPQKPGSILTNLLDTLYDSYLDPKAGEKDDSEDEFNGAQRSVSRFDMSLSSLF